VTLLNNHCRQWTVSDVTVVVQGTFDRINIDTLGFSFLEKLLKLIFLRAKSSELIRIAKCSDRDYKTECMSCYTTVIHGLEGFHNM